MKYRGKRSAHNFGGERECERERESGAHSIADKVSAYGAKGPIKIKLQLRSTLKKS